MPLRKPLSDAEFSQAVTDWLSGFAQHIEKCAREFNEEQKARE